MVLHILNADESHRAELAAMARDYHTEANPDQVLATDEEALAEECERLFASTLPDWSVRIPEIDGKLAGFIVFALVDDRQALVLYELYVRPWARRRGVGQALVQSALSSAAEQGVSYAGTAVAGWNDASFALFQKMGFGVNRYMMGRCGDLSETIG